jgi:CelD/BcsL family acetyltransferase involved in cellulose biosynthesis
MRRNLRRYRRRAEKISELAFESASEKNFDEFFNTLIDLHCARWNRLNEPGVLCESTTRRFHMQAHARSFDAEYRAFMRCALMAGSWPAFMHCSAAGKCVSYIGGFDPHLAQPSVGTLAIGHAIEEAKREGAGTFNFLRGAERYKAYWGADDHYVYSRKLTA